MTSQSIAQLATKSKTSSELLQKITEDVALSNGQRIFIVHGMGQASVKGTFQGIANGGMAKVTTEDGKELNVMAHLVFPLR